MAIRARISANLDNVITVETKPKVNIKDNRGSFDPKGRPYDGSMLDHMGVPQEEARTTLMRMASQNPDGLAVPKDLPVQDLLSFLRLPNNPGHSVELTYRNRVRSPLTAIRAWCVECKGFSPKAVAKCDAVSCPYWALRMGRNAHYGKSK